MSKSYFDWDNFNWDNFQILIIHFAQSILRDYNFEEYLKQGHKQFGIDLISVSSEEGKYITIQCKKEITLSKTKIQTIVDEFVKGKFRDRSSKFILATSADLQREPLKRELEIIQCEFAKNYGYEFIVWDRNFIQAQLANCYSIVAFFFGVDAANRNCFPPLAAPEEPANNLLQDYLKRYVRIFIEKNRALEYYWQKEKIYTLSDIFSENRLATKRICLIADAYQGKTCLLRQTAYELQNAAIPFVPLFIELKKFNIQPLAEILTVRYHEWRQIPLKDIVVLIDGLDEVPTDKFDTMVRHIYEFSSRYPAVSLIFSCRKIFFTHYKVDAILDAFTVYDLVPISDYEVHDYINTSLKQKADKFDTLIIKAGIRNFLYHPFYLIYLVNSFKKSPATLPVNKIQVIEDFIDNSYNASRLRRLKEGKALHQQLVKYRQVIQKFAFALQLTGLNSFSSEQVQLLFDNAEIELLQHNSLITAGSDNWSFNNALFQEHLAALLLSKMQYEEIVNHISVGVTIKKVKTKWIQTVSSLLSILESTTDTFKKLVLFVENDNLELLFMAERTKFTSDFRFTILKKLITYYAKYDLHPMLIHEPVIASFIDDLGNAKKYLLGKLSNETLSVRVKVSICRIVHSLVLTDAQRAELSKIACREIKNTSDPFYAKQLFEALATFGLGDKKIVSEFLYLSLNACHNFRDGMYMLIRALGLVDEFYDYGLGGLDILVEHNRRMHYGASEYAFEEFVLEGGTHSNIRKLLALMCTEKWLNYYRHASTRKERFFDKLIPKLIDLYNDSKYIIFPVIEFAKIVEKRHRKEEFTEIDNFFRKVDAGFLIVRLLLNEIVVDLNWDIASLLTADCFDYLLFELEELEIDKQISVLRNCVNGLRYHGKTEPANILYQLAIEVTEGKVLDVGPSYQDEYEKVENIKKQNDFKYLSNVTEFKKGLIAYFDAYGKQKVLVDDLYVNEDSIEVRKHVSSNAMYHFLLRWRFERTIAISLKEGLKALENNNLFEFFRADEILDYNFTSDEDKKILVPILEQYFQTEIKTAKFENCLWVNKDGFHFYRKEKLLGDIFLKYQFALSFNLLIKLVWLDQSGTRLFIKNEYSNKKEKSIAELILERIGEDDEKLELFKQYILHNMKTKIKAEGVLGTHIALCKELKIEESRDLIYTLIKKAAFTELYLSDLIDTYLELNGDYEKIVTIFKKYKHYNDYTYRHLIQVLIKDYPAVVVESMLKCLADENSQRDIKVSVARDLASLNVKDGFKYLVDYIKQTNQSPYTIQGGYQVHMIDTQFALSKLTDIIHLTLETESAEVRFFDSPRSIIIEWLYGFSFKSENDLELVVAWLSTQQKKLEVTCANSKDLYWYAKKAVETFRDSEKTIKTIDQVIPIINKVQIVGYT